MNKKILENWPVKTIEIDDENYPKNLREISNPPKKLFYRGEWDNSIFEKTLAIVGSRKMTKYGQGVIENLMPEIIIKKATVISGFMYGVDCESHQQCLNLGGKTIAVLGGGLNWMYADGNKKLYERILEQGGIIMSEYEPNCQASLWTFPQRNRIVAGLATVGVLVVEADIKSGSLITAKLTLKQKKKLMAIPGQIGARTSNGTNWLIKSGSAKMVTEASDIFEDIIRAPEQKSLFKDFSDLSQIEKNIIDVLENEECDIDYICRRLGKSVTEISIILSTLLMRDLIFEENGKYFIN